jgi:S1 RNA binding domain protein
MQLEVGAILEGKVTGITKFGVFVDLPENKTGMVHISEVASAYVKEIRDFVTEGQTVKVKVLSISDDGKISLSMKKAVPPQPKQSQQSQRSSSRRPGDYEWQSKPEPTSFEDMMSKFKQSSDEKMSALKKGMQQKRGGGYSRHGTGSQR